MKMKQMPFRTDDGAVERAKYRAKMAVREAAHPSQSHIRKVQWRWATAIAVAAVVVVGVFGFVKYGDQIFGKQAPMDALISQMQNASDDIVYEMTVDCGYYLEEENRL